MTATAAAVEPIPMPEPGEAVADTPTIAVWLDVPVGTVKRWAQADRWPRKHSTTSRGRHTEYSLRAARATYERLRGDANDHGTATDRALVAE